LSIIFNRTPAPDACVIACWNGSRNREAFTSVGLLSELAHRLMAIEAGTLPGWTGGKVMNRLKNQPTVVLQLTGFQAAVDAVLKSRIHVHPITGPLVSVAATLSKQHGLLTNDALILALMQHHGLANLASHDADFDRVAGITRYTPA
jgi:predicted nucleic acid-binding protein